MSEPITPELAAALVAAQAEARSLARDGSGQHGAYTSSDEIASVARTLLSKHGLAWLRTGVDFKDGGLAQCELGNQYYVGDVVEQWTLVHISGATMGGSTRMPVVASKGRPHDKAAGASLTYDAGATLRGILCLDREDKNNAVDRRHDDDDQQAQPVPVQSTRLQLLQHAVAAKVDDYSDAFNCSRSEAWAEACQNLAGFDRVIGNGQGPHGCGPEDLARIDLALTDALVAK